MPMTIQAFFGIAAGIAEFAAFAIYIRSVIKKETKPDRVTWWILGLVSGMITASYFASGARETIWLPAVFTFCMLAVAILSLKYGEGPARLSAIDRVSLAGAILSAVVWWLIRSPLPALYMNIATEFIGLIPTINKAYRRPWTESSAAWIIGTIGAALNIFAITEWTLAIALYPVYVFVTNVAITYFIMQKKVS